jgi:hypothetical protein
VTDGRTIEVDPARLAGWIERFRARHGAILASRAAQTVRLEAADGSSVSVEVPWPPLAEGEDAAAVLLDHVQAPRRLGLLLVRKGGHAVGVAGPEGLSAAKVGSRHVQGRAKAGGWSQQRFARRRENQARDAYAAAADAAATMLLPVLDRLDGLVTGGDRRAVAEVLRDSRLRPLAELPQGRFLAVPDPRRKVLEKAAEDCRAVRLHVVDITRGDVV